MRKIIYIAGPISDPDPAQMLCNIHRFAEVENAMIREGFAPINPAADATAVGLGGISYEMVMEKDRSLILVCDAIYFMYNWKDSAGARREHKWAKSKGILCFEESNLAGTFDLDKLAQAIYEDYAMEAMQI